MLTLTSNTQVHRTINTKINKNDNNYSILTKNNTPVHFRCLHRKRKPFGFTFIIIDEHVEQMYERRLKLNWQLLAERRIQETGAYSGSEVRGGA